jgi:hypothetical protein
MSIYSDAVASIRAYSDARQAELDAVAAAERVKSIATLRNMAIDGVPSDHPARPVCELVAHTITVGRDDGYPAIDLPRETLAAVVAAKNAGLLRVVPGPHSCAWVGKIEIYADGSGVSSQAPSADFQAWDTARKYREAQTVKRL